MILVFFLPLLFGPQKSLAWTVLLGSLQACGRKGLAISIPVAPALQGRWPSPSQSSLTRGWEAAGLWGWAWGLGQDLAPGWLVPFNIGAMGAVLIEEAGCEGLQCGMGQQGRPSVDEGGCHGVLEKAGCLSGFCVRKELDKTGSFFAPSASCFDAEDDEATAAAAHEQGVCTLLPASGFNQCCCCILPGPAPWLPVPGEGRDYGGINC